MEVGALSTWYEKLVEGFWFMTCLALFMVLGPFAAPIALGFIFSNNAFKSDLAEPEPLEQ